MRYLLELCAKEKDESKAEQTKDMELQKLLAENANSSASKDSWKSGKGARGDRELQYTTCLLYTSPSPRDKRQSRMPSSA